VIAKLARGLHRGFALGQRESDALECGKIFAKGLALLNIGPAFIERGLRGANAEQAEQCALARSGERIALGREAPRPP